MSVFNPPRQEIMWNDGSRITLHALANAQGAEQEYLRMLMLPEGDLQVDLRHLVEDFEHDCRSLRPMDVPGLVFFGLRLRFRNVEAFVDAARAQGTLTPATQRLAA